MKSMSEKLTEIVDRFILKLKADSKKEDQKELNHENVLQKVLYSNGVYQGEFNNSKFHGKGRF